MYFGFARMSHHLPSHLGVDADDAQYYFLLVFAALRTYAVWDSNRKVFVFVLFSGSLYPIGSMVSIKYSGQGMFVERPTVSFRDECIRGRSGVHGLLCGYQAFRARSRKNRDV